MVVIPTEEKKREMNENRSELKRRYIDMLPNVQYLHVANTHTHTHKRNADQVVDHQTKSKLKFRAINNGLLPPAKTTTKY